MGSGVSVSVALMCHPKRRHFVDELEAQLPEATVVWDEKNDRWDTGRRSLLAFDPRASHHLVIQDDAIVCRNLIVACERMVEFSGDERCVSLYTGKTRPYANIITPVVHKALNRGVPWIATKGPLWGPGLLLPTALIPEIVAFGDDCPVENYDRKIETYYLQHDIDCWYSIPSLVQHREVSHNPSLIPGRIGNRTAHDFIGSSDPLAIDWSIPPLELAFA